MRRKCLAIKSSSRPSLLTGGWTITEVLVVAAVIVVLASALVPSIKSLQKIAGGARCVSNLRQIGLALHLYAQEKGFFPHHISGSTRWFDGTEDTNSFFAGPYLKSKPRHRRLAPAGNWTSAQGGLFDCPTITTEDKAGLGPDEWIEDYFDYAQNITVSGRSPNALANPSKTVLVAEGGHYGRVKAATSTGLLYTPNAPSNPGGTQWNHSSANRNSPIAYQHNGKANFLFLDGHVSAHSHDELNERWFDGK